MYLLVFIILLLILLFVLSYVKEAVIRLRFDTNQNDMYLLITWLYPLLKANITMAGYSPFITVYVFNRSIYSKSLKTEKKRRDYSKYLKALSLRDTYAKINYGLDDPFSTGIASGIIHIIQSYFENISISHTPDFVPEQGYIVLEAGTKLNLAKTLIKLIRNRHADRKNQRRERYGSVQFG